MYRAAAKPTWEVTSTVLVQYICAIPRGSPISGVHRGYNTEKDVFRIFDMCISRVGAFIQQKMDLLEELMLGARGTSKVLHLSKSNRAFGAATFHRQTPQPPPPPSLLNPPYLYHKKKISIKQMDFTQGIN